jgi:hypothetical protein
MSNRVLLAVFLLVGCEHSDEDARSFRSAVDQIWCETVFSCCAQPRYATVDACIVALKSGSASFFGAPSSEPQPDPAEWNQARADGCLAQLRAAASSCDHPVQSADYFSAFCDAAYAPALAAGEACTRSISFYSPRCDFDQGDVCLSSQVCGHALDDGQPCNNNAFDCKSLDCNQVCQPAKPVHVWLCGS